MDWETHLANTRISDKKKFEKIVVFTCVHDDGRKDLVFERRGRRLTLRLGVQRQSKGRTKSPTADNVTQLVHRIPHTAQNTFVATISFS